MDTSSQRVEDLFHSARKFGDPAARKVFLDQACAGEPDLRTQVEALLDASTMADPFFTSSAPVIEGVGLGAGGSDAAAEAAPRQAVYGDQVGARIGRYILLEKLGEGGCGVVYLAEQEAPVQRRVALKIIKRGMEFRSVIARFEAERQALAIMDHPNIARVFDAGETETGFPYFVMELVRGVRITHYCDENGLGLRQRLDLFIQICHAIQHAHQKGIIHRDIKPSNIVVALHDGVPVPKVIDFGIAQATEARLAGKLLAGEAAQLIGTPAYMSPEQLDLGWMDIDTRSDIYSLGVLLYELLTGTTPFDGKKLMEGGVDGLRTFLRDNDVPKASSRLAHLPAAELAQVAKRRRVSPQHLLGILRDDLDWVLAKALQRDRSRRYETANGLAMDIQRHLNSEAVAARPRSWLYQFRKIVRRNRAVFAAAGAVAASLVAGLGASTYLFLKEREARQRAVAAEQQQARLRHDAETREKITQATLLVNQGRYEQADRLLAGLSLNQPSVEAAAAFRAVGEWHALEGRWKQAAEHFEKLLQLDELDGWDVASLDTLRLGPALVNCGDLEHYSRFREALVESYLKNPWPAADRVIKICLLTPLDERTVAVLAPIAARSSQQMEQAEANGDVFQAAWLSLSMSLWEYRNGNFRGAEQWARRCLAYTDYNAPRMATAHAILALAMYKRGFPADARSELAMSDNLVEAKSRTPMDRGTPVQGFWFDWSFARILLDEAAGVIGRSHG